MKRFLSYIYPITKKIKSKYSGDLELTWYNGYKVLNTKNTNYSYGSLQEILDFALSKITLKNVSKTLLLGLGAGSVVVTLRNKYQYEEHITAVEIDEVLIKIACEEYQICTDDKLEIHQQDAFEFIKNNNEQYDLIIIDLFIDNRVPDLFYSELFITHLKQHFTTNAFFIFNLGMQNDLDTIVADVMWIFATTFDMKLFIKVLGTNTLLIGKKM